MDGGCCSREPQFPPVGIPVSSVSLSRPGHMPEVIVDSIQALAEWLEAGNLQSMHIQLIFSGNAPGILTRNPKEVGHVAGDVVCVTFKPLVFEIVVHLRVGQS